MLLKPLQSKPGLLTRALRMGVAGLGLVAAVAATSSGCLDRPVAPAAPRTSNVFVDIVRQTAVDKIDLLLMIDNSLSMADKQILLSLAVPQLVNRLVNPLCVDPNNPSAAGQPADASGNCAPNLQREFKAITNIHIGIVTSSLGGHGADACSPASPVFNPTQDDHAHLIGTNRPNNNPALVSWNGTGFLVWDPNNPPKHTPTGAGLYTDSTALIAEVENHVKAAGEQGCGYEASLEAWYRFLIDPAPPGNVVVNNNQAEVQGLDQVVLDQRSKFLRPDSLVAVIMLTDENDCSTIDGGPGWLMATSQLNGGIFHLPRATSACATDPNSSCCRSCGLQESAPPSGCGALSSDPECAKGSWDDVGDSVNLRCFEDKRRFGIDFLYPIDRYTKGLTQSTIIDRSGKQVPNPLYTDLTGGNALPRDNSLVFFAGIIGVPWQDIATSDTLNDQNRLKYMDATTMRANGVWANILDADGDPTNGLKPNDGLMWEKTEDRVTLGAPPNPPTGAPLVPSSSTNPTANPINGHEYITTDANGSIADLQYACIFPLSTAIGGPKDCTTVPTGSGCDCRQGTQAQNKPLCNGTTQIAAKAYPGVRELQVLNGMRDAAGGVVDNAIVASICPKITDQANPDFGYNPAVGAIIDRLKQALSVKCLPRTLNVDPNTGTVPCVIVEAVYSPGSCDCSAPGRAPLSGDKTALVDPVRSQLQSVAAVCGGATGKSCSDFCLCEIQPAAPDLAACQNDLNPPPDDVGYCYVDPFNPDPTQAVGNADLVKDCPATERRLLRFVGADTPANGSITFIACQGASIGVLQNGAPPGP